MTTRLIANAGLSYPADPESLALVRAAGGFTKLSDDECARVRIKYVVAGEPCDDVPEESRARLLELGLIAELPAAAAAPEVDDVR